MEEESVHVVVRIRPMQANEKKKGDVPCVKAISNGKEVQVKVGPLEAQNYRCHKCFNPETSQTIFFDECGISDLLDSTIEGYRTCVFAYGQTGAGKTYSMVGGPKGLSHNDKHGGLIARSIGYLFDKLNSLEYTYQLRLSCVEIYQEHVFDLFAEEKERISLPVREHSSEGFFLEGLKLIECKDYSTSCSVLEMALKNRQVGGHDLNNRSSRSHCITEIYIDVTAKISEDDVENMTLGTQKVFRGKISLVDLAGSERLKETNSTGKVLQEAGFINKSLYVLGKVIAGLVRTNGDLNHKDVPFRDSKLTKLLITSLGGHSRTLLIACVSEAKGSQSETLRTLKFSMSCARIRNKPVKFLDPQEKLILDLKQEIKRLKNENKKLRTTLLTAPASSSQQYATFSDEEASPFARANSARNHRQPEKIAKQKKGGVFSEKNSKVKIMKSDFLARYPQLQNILKREQVPQHQKVAKTESDPQISVNDGEIRGRFRPHFKSAVENLVRSSSDGPNQMSPRTDGLTDPKKRMSVEILDEMVRRKAPGPMIFKDKASPIVSIREENASRYNPAENYSRHMDKQSGLVHGEPSQQSKPTNMQDFEEKKKKRVSSKPPKPVKPSPYLSHLLGKKKSQKEKVVENTISKEKPPIQPGHPTAISSTSIQEAVEKELEELGLAAIISSKNPVPQKQNESRKKEKKLTLPSIPNKSSAKSQPSKPTTENDEIKDYLPPLTDENRKMKEKTDADELSDSALRVLDNNMQQQEEMVTRNAKLNNAPITPVSLRQKLSQLEASLAQQRMEMEDNPGYVTNEMEEKYNTLQLETKMLRVELTKITGEPYPATPKEKSKMSVTQKEESPEDDYGEEFYEEDSNEEDATKATVETSKMPSHLVSSVEKEKDVKVTPTKTAPLNKIAERTTVETSKLLSPLVSSVEKGKDVKVTPTKTAPLNKIAEPTSPTRPTSSNKFAETNYSEDYENEFENEDAETQPEPRSTLASPEKSSKVPSDIHTTPTSVAEVAQIAGLQESIAKKSNLEVDQNNEEDQYGNDEFDDFED